MLIQLKKRSRGLSQTAHKVHAARALVREKHAVVLKTLRGMATKLRSKAKELRSKARELSALESKLAEAWLQSEQSQVKANKLEGNDSQFNVPEAAPAFTEESVEALDSAVSSLELAADDIDSKISDLKAEWKK